MGAASKNGERKNLKKHELMIRSIVNRAIDGEVRASKQALDVMKLKLEDIQHQVVVELLGRNESGKRDPKSNAKPEPAKPIPTLGLTKS